MTTMTTEAINPEVPKTPAMKAEENFEMWETELAWKNSTLLAAWGVFLDTYAAAKEAAGFAQDSAVEANAAGYDLAVSDYCVPALDVIEDDGVVTVTENLAYRELHDEEAEMETLRDEVRTKWLATRVQDAPSGAMAEYTEAQNRLNAVLYGD